MKKFKAILFASSIAFILGCSLISQSNAQVVSATMHTTTSSSVDSIRCISTTPNYLYIAPTLSYKAGSFQAVATRISAAMGGSVFLQGSVDGTTYYTASSNTGDTITVSNAATSTGAIVVKSHDGFPYRFYRLKCTGASSDTMTVRATFIGR